MSSVVLDASALLAYLFKEQGSDLVVRHLPHGILSALNYEEVLSRCVDKGTNLEQATAQVGRLRLSHWPFDAEQAATAASLRASTREFGLSQADRACLALAMTRNLPVLTADRQWTNVNIGVPIELIR